MVGLHLRGKTAQAQRQPMLRVEVAVQWFVVCSFCLTPRLTGAGARSAQGTNTGHKNAEGMASVGVRVEPPVRHFCNVMEPVYWVGKIFLFWL